MSKKTDFTRILQIKNLSIIHYNNKYIYNLIFMLKNTLILNPVPADKQDEKDNPCKFGTLLSVL